MKPGYAPVCKKPLLVKLVAVQPLLSVQSWADLRVMGRFADVSLFANMRSKKPQETFKHCKFSLNFCTSSSVVFCKFKDLGSK